MSTCTSVCSSGEHGTIIGSCGQVMARKGASARARPHCPVDPKAGFLPRLHGRPRRSFRAVAAAPVFFVCSVGLAPARAWVAPAAGLRRRLRWRGAASFTPTAVAGN